MSNYLKVEAQEAIKHPLKTERSQRWIARELGVHQRTVKRYAKELSDPKCTISRTGKVGRPSNCEAYRQRNQIGCDPERFGSHYSITDFYLANSFLTAL